MALCAACADPNEAEYCVGKEFSPETEGIVSYNLAPSELTECGFLHGGVENGRARNPLTLCSVAALVHVQVWVHMPGDPQNVQLRNDTTTTTTTYNLAFAVE